MRSAGRSPSSRPRSRHDTRLTRRSGFGGISSKKRRRRGVGKCGRRVTAPPPGLYCGRKKRLGLRGEPGVVEAVGKYRIVFPLGQGGTADVFLAVAEGPSVFHKLVVVKVLRKSLASDADFRQMFLSEARLAARLHHPNVVQTNEVIEDDGAPVLVMEYLDGQPLSQVIVRGKQGGC